MQKDVREITFVFKGLLKENVFLFEVNSLTEDLRCCVTLGTIVVNLLDEERAETQIQGNKVLFENSNSKKYVEECVKIARSLITVIR